MRSFAYAPAPAAGGDGSVLGIAAAFHDLGIWTDRTFDSLGPSRRLARACLAAGGRSALAPAVEAIIEQHHKPRPYRGPFAEPVESFQRTDLFEVSPGTLVVDPVHFCRARGGPAERRE